MDIKSGPRLADGSVSSLNQNPEKKNEPIQILYYFKSDHFEQRFSRIKAEWDSGCLVVALVEVSRFPLSATEGDKGENEGGQWRRKRRTSSDAADRLMMALHGFSPLEGWEVATVRRRPSEQVVPHPPLTESVRR